MIYKVSITTQLLFILLFYVLPNLGINSPIIIEILWVISIILGFISFYLEKSKSKITFIISIFLTIVYIIGLGLEKM